MRTPRLFLLLAALAAAPSAHAADFVYTGPVNIPAVLAVGTVLPFPITFNVSGVATVADVNLSFTGLSHTFSDDLAVALVSPSSTAVLIMNRAGGSANWVNASLTFDQQAAAPIANGSLAFSNTNNILSGGAYLPSVYGTGPLLDFLVDGTDLGLFNGENGNGVWSLYMLDNKPLDKGSFASVTLSLTAARPPAVPEPASWVLLIAGFAMAGAALRRRNTGPLPAVQP
jgi:subtilisin-like proprotein convertase family protein